MKNREAYTMRKLVAILLILTFAVPSFALAKKANPVNFDDPVLEPIIRQALHIPDGEVTSEDMATLRVINVKREWEPNADPSTQVRSLAALVYCTNLEALGLPFQNISDISPLSKLTKMQILELDGNPIQDLSALEKLTNLQTLSIANCQARDYTVLQKLKNLESLDLAYSDIPDATPLAGLTKLRYLTLQGTQITDYSPLMNLYSGLMDKDFELDVAALTRYPDREAIQFNDPVLERLVRAALNLPKGKITFADVKYVTTLDINTDWRPDAYPPDTQITDIGALRYFVSLRRLSMQFHAVSDISALSELTQLTDLGLGGNPIRDIAPLANLTQLSFLTLFNCQASDYRALSNLTNLDRLQLEYSTISDISPLAALTNLRWLSLKGTSVADVAPLAGLQNLQGLELEGDPISDYSPLREIYPYLVETDFTLDAQAEPETSVSPEAEAQGWEYDQASRTLTLYNDVPMTAYQPDRADYPEGSTRTDAPWGDYLSEIKQIVVGDAVTKMSDYAFAYCTALKKITIGENVTSIGKRCLYRCGDWQNKQSLTIIIRCTAMPSLGEDVMGYTWDNSNVYVTVPQEHLTDWQNAIGQHGLQLTAR